MKTPKPIGVGRRWEWNPYFAWRPVQMLDGRWVWWEWVERTSWLNRDVRANSPQTLIGWWVFRPSPAQASGSRKTESDHG